VTTGSDPWAVRLTAAAEVDFEDILRWTVERFGDAQARAYAETLSSALEALVAGPSVIGAKARDDIAKGLFTLHVARQGRKGRHFVVFRIGRDREREVIEVLRLLHDAMDLPRHLPPVDETDEE
jgi:toxin ParE1/3/4